MARAGPYLPSGLASGMVFDCGFPVERATRRLETGRVRVSRREEKRACPYQSEIVATGAETAVHIGSLLALMFAFDTAFHAVFSNELLHPTSAIALLLHHQRRREAKGTACE